MLILHPSSAALSIPVLVTQVLLLHISLPVTRSIVIPNHSITFYKWAMLTSLQRFVPGFLSILIQIFISTSKCWVPISYKALGAQTSISSLVTGYTPSEGQDGKWSQMKVCIPWGGNQGEEAMYFDWRPWQRFPRQHLDEHLLLVESYVMTWSVVFVNSQGLDPRTWLSPPLWPIVWDSSQEMNLSGERVLG